MRRLLFILAVILVLAGCLINVIWEQNNGLEALWVSTPNATTPAVVQTLPDYSLFSDGTAMKTVRSYKNGVMTEDGHQAGVYDVHGDILVLRLSGADRHAITEIYRYRATHRSLKLSDCNTDAVIWQLSRSAR